MLYRTRHPLFFQFHPFTCSIPSLSSFSSLPNTSLSSIPFLSYPTPSQGETEMECVEAALKTSFRKEMAMKSNQQMAFDDLCGVNVQNVATCDDFFVDDLLDFSNEDGLVEEEEPEGEEDKGFLSVSLQKQNRESEISHLKSTSLSPKDDFASVPTGELNLPAEDMADLEWLSQFVDESENSFSEFSSPLDAVIFPAKPKNNQTELAPEPESPPSPNFFKTPFPAKARSKRIRAGGRVWSFGSPPLTESSSSSTSSSSSSSPSSSWLICSSFQSHETADTEKLPAKKQKKRPDLESIGSAQPPRRCSHCGVQKTPQWRTGPLGAKTLCNACGVRFKSGRLLPEYRPACSPTFSSDLHSNHHRKVLEMRRKKEIVPESGFIPVVPSF